MTVGNLFDRIGRYGSENFKIDKNHRFASLWEAMKESRSYMSSKMNDVLIMSLPIGEKPSTIPPKRIKLFSRARK